MSRHTFNSRIINSKLNKLFFKDSMNTTNNDLNYNSMNKTFILKNNNVKNNMSLRKRISFLI